MSKSLPEGTWRFVGYLADGAWQPVSDSSQAELLVEDGRLSGTAGVNRLMGSSIELPLGPVAMTLMAGPPELMEQEHRIVEHLNSVDDVVSGLSGMFLLSDGLEVVELVREGTKSDPPHV